MHSGLVGRFMVLTDHFRNIRIHSVSDAEVTDEMVLWNHDNLHVGFADIFQHWGRAWRPWWGPCRWPSWSLTLTPTTHSLSSTPKTLEKEPVSINFKQPFDLLWTWLFRFLQIAKCSCCLCVFLCQFSVCPTQWKRCVPRCPALTSSSKMSTMSLSPVLATATCPRSEQLVCNFNVYKQPQPAHSSSHTIPRLFLSAFTV